MAYNRLKTVIVSQFNQLGFSTVAKCFTYIIVSDSIFVQKMHYLENISGKCTSTQRQCTTDLENISGNVLQHRDNVDCDLMVNFVAQNILYAGQIERYYKPTGQAAIVLISSNLRPKPIGQLPRTSGPTARIDIERDWVSSIYNKV